MKKALIISLLFCLQWLMPAQAQAQVNKGSALSQQDSSATVILKNVSRSNYAYCVAVVRGQLISTRNLKPGHSQSFKVPLPGTSLYKFKISLDKDEEYTYSIEPPDYVSQVSSEEVGPGTYEYLIDYDKTQDVISVKLVKFN